MLLSFFSFLVGFALLLLVFFVLINRQKDKKLNLYFLIIIGVLGMNQAKGAQRTQDAGAPSTRAMTKRMSCSGAR